MSGLSLSDLPPAVLDPFNDRWDVYAAAVQSGGEARLEDVLKGVAESAYRALLRHALKMEWELRQRLRHPVNLEDYLDRFGDDGLVRAAFAEVQTVPHAPAAKLQQLPRVPGYEVLEKLGRGGMGVVYKARHEGLRRLEALKMILTGRHASPDELRRFRTEAEAVARLQHPNIVQVFDARGEHDGLPYFSMELVPGGTLAARLAGAPLPDRQAAALVRALAEAMAAAHRANVIHRDLKPANILLTADGVPKVTDFGLAKLLENGPGQTVMAGTPSYMAPEQAGGPFKDIGPATDVYGLGAILYECLTGRPPFKAATEAETLCQVRETEPASPRQLNAAVDRALAFICLKCLEKDPAHRYPSAQELAADLGRWLDGERIPPEPLPIWLWRQLQSPCRLDRPKQWAHVFRYLAAWRVICHGVMALLLQLSPAPEAYWAWFIGLHVGTWLPIWRLLQSERRLDPHERGVLLNWGATFACDALLFALFCPPWGQARPEEVVRVYAAWPAAHGLWYVMEGRRSWGRFYAVAMAYFVLAPLLSLCGLLAPVVYALVVASALLLLGDGLRRLAKQQADDRHRHAALEAAGPCPLPPAVVDG